MNFSKSLTPSRLVIARSPRIPFCAQKLQKRGYLASAGTLLNPRKSLRDVITPSASNDLTRSLLVVATPQHAAQLAELAETLSTISLYSAAVDTIGFGGQRDGFSWMVFEDEIKTLDAVPVGTPSAASLGRQWAMPEAALKLSSSNGMEISLPLASTLFTTGQPFSLYGGTFEPVAGLHLQLPINWSKSDNMRPITPITEKLEITSSTDNMLKTLDNQAAASFLERAEKLISEASEDRAVFAEIESKSTGTTTVIKVIAGGGGLWSARSRMLVLEPPYKAVPGDKIQFYLFSGRKLSGSSLELLNRHYARIPNLHERSAMFEVAPINESLDELPYTEYKRDEFFSTFAAGSEQGFLLNDERHCVPGESLLLKSS